MVEDRYRAQDERRGLQKRLRTRPQRGKQRQKREASHLARERDGGQGVERGEMEERDRVSSQPGWNQVETRGTGATPCGIPGLCNHQFSYPIQFWSHCFHLLSLSRSLYFFFPPVLPSSLSLLLARRPFPLFIFFLLSLPLPSFLFLVPLYPSLLSSPFLVTFFARFLRCYYAWVDFLLSLRVSPLSS